MKSFNRLRELYRKLTGEPEGEEKSVTVEEVFRSEAGVSILYTSGFPKQQLGYAKRARDIAGKTEVVFGGEDVVMVPDEEKREFERNVVSALVNSIGFLEGQKYWFIYRLEEEDWGFQPTREIQEKGWKGLEDAFVRMLDVSGHNSDPVKNNRAYEEVKTLREFRNDLLHFESPKVKAGEEADEYDLDEELENLDFPANSIGTANTYPFKWFSYELAERSVRMSFTLWRVFARQLGKEEEFTSGISPN